jgi:hypothetical protein
MNKLILLLALVLSTGIAQAQKTTMTLEMSNGKRINIDVDSITAMHVTPLAPPENRVVLLNTQDPVATVSSAAHDAFDFYSFKRKNGLMFFMWGSNYGFVLDPFRFVRPDSVLESITFSKYAADTAVEQKLVEGLTSQWVDSSVYIGHRESLDRFELSSRIATRQDHGDLSFEFNRAGTKLLYTAKTRSYNDGGYLVELDVASGRLDTLSRDSSVTNGRYIGDSDSIVYYSQGSFHYLTNPIPYDAGYYFLDRVSDTARFVYTYGPPGMMDMLLNGFDVSSDGQKILMPECSSQQVKLTEYDIESDQAVVLPIDWDVSKAYNSLWVQYSSNDSLILYSLGGVFNAASIGGGESEVGIIDRKTLTRKAIAAAPHSLRPFSIPYPRWSADDSAITYGAGEIPAYVFDGIKPYYIYIKKL